MPFVTLKLTRGEIKVLTSLAADHAQDGDYDTTELIVAAQGSWHLGAARTSGAISNSLLRMVLISEAHPTDGDFRVYRINDWGRKALAGEPINVPDVLLPFMRIAREKV